MRKTVNAELRFDIVAGRMRLRGVIRSIKAYCIKRGYDFSIQKGFGILEVPLVVKILLPYVDGKQAEKELKSLFC